MRSTVQPGNAGLSGTVPLIQFPLLAKTAGGRTARIPNLRGTFERTLCILPTPGMQGCMPGGCGMFLCWPGSTSCLPRLLASCYKLDLAPASIACVTDPELAAVRPPPVRRAPPPPSAGARAAARPATVAAVVSLAGRGLWPFTPLQQVLPGAVPTLSWHQPCDAGRCPCVVVLPSERACCHPAASAQRGSQEWHLVQAALRGVVLQSLGNVQSDISEAQLTVGAATVIHFPTKAPKDTQTS
jgi:hypothetical protein